MSTPGTESVPSVPRYFAIGGELLTVTPLKSGHIHDTLLASYAARAGPPLRLIHQRLNGRIFPDLAALMDNLVRVTEHIRSKLAQRGEPEPERHCLRLVLGRDGRPYHIDAKGDAWRSFHWIEDAHTVDTPEHPEQAWQVARAFGEFVAMLEDLPAPPLVVTIPRFHDLAVRWRALEAALRVDACDRAEAVRELMERARRSHAALEEALERGGAARLPRRIVHHDCKVNNVMLDARSGAHLCVIDLDTVMEGNILSDFGELVRSAVCPAPEDERDLDRIGVDLELFRAVAEGYLGGLGDRLAPIERDLLPLAGPLFALMNGIRFLTDHLEGDVYFRVERTGQNLDRARAQLQLCSCLLAARREITALLADAARRQASSEQSVSG